MWRWVFGFCAVVLAVPYAGLPAEQKLRTVQSAASDDIAVGSVLIANEDLPDPNFAESVVLIVQYDEDEGTLGLILNRRSEIPLSKVFTKVKGAGSDPVYVGGPVGRRGAQALLRLSNQTEGAVHVVGDIYATAARDLIEKSVASGTAASRFRVYVGYAGWGSGQLEKEIALGAWSVLGPSPSMIFDDDPDSLWQRLKQQSERQVARLLIPSTSLIDLHR